MGWLNLDWIAVLVTAYLLGSLPIAYLAGRILKGKDIRQEGDHNPGAENAYRNIGHKTGLAVGALDIGKGIVAVLIARLITGHEAGEMAAGALAVAGHNWPVFLQMRGGRGAATTVGVLMAIMPFAAIPVSFAGLVVFLTGRGATVTLSSFMIPVPFVALFVGVDTQLVLYSVGLPVFVGIRHYLTSRRLLRGEAKQAERQMLPQR